VERIERLFEFLLAKPELMPVAYRDESAREPLHRQVCDYIAGMTDGFFDRTCDQLGIGGRQLSRPAYVVIDECGM
jgi:dGTPase